MIFIILAGIIGVIVIVLAILVFVYLFAFQPHMIKGVSMVPTYASDAYVVSNKLVYRTGEPVRGDVIIFKYPKAQDVDYIERIVGLPGEKIQIFGGQVYIDSKVLDEPYLEKRGHTFSVEDGFIDEGEIITIPANNYFVMGDNREHSLDSRIWGFVPKENIIGKVTFCYANCSKTQ